ncbi:hypothetical protein HFP71_00700 [Streptomyces sp. ARC32]
MCVIVAVDFGLLFSAGVFNPSFTTYRMAATPDAFMARVATSWSVGQKTCQAAFMIAGGVVAAAAGVRGALLVAGLLCLASALLLPWRQTPVPDGEVPAPATEASAPAPAPAARAPPRRAPPRRAPPRKAPSRKAPSRTGPFTYRPRSTPSRAHVGRFSSGPPQPDRAVSTILGPKEA